MSRNKEGAYVPVKNYIPEVLEATATMHDREYFQDYVESRSQSPQTLVLPTIYNSSTIAGQQLRVKSENREGVRIIYTIHEYNPLIDSSNMQLVDYLKIAKDIEDSYHEYDGFVILHGTDTLAYTASTLSFLCENLGKPIVLTGAQVPAAEMRSDAFDNILGSIVIAGNYKIPEVSVFFNRKLFRGNRVQKVDADEFDAFTATNSSPLVEMGINIRVNSDAIWRTHEINKFQIAKNWSRKVGLLRIFPTITAQTVRHFLQPGMDGVVLQTYGAGNGPSNRKDIMAEIKAATDRGCLIVNCTQCHRGNVTTEYEAGLEFEKIGVVPGHDMTIEAALAKLSYICGMADKLSIEEQRQKMKENLRGELTAHKIEESSSYPFDTEFIEAVASVINTSSEDEMLRVKRAIFPALLCSAAREDNVKQLKILKDQGADYNCEDYDKRTPLHIAAAEGNLKAMKELIEHGALVHSKFKNQVL